MLRWAGYLSRKLYIMILKTRFEPGFESNRYLGGEYQLISPSSPDRFNKELIEMYGENAEGWRKDIYGFIVADCGKITEPLFTNYEYRIFCDNGDLFDPLYKN